MYTKFGTKQHKVLLLDDHNEYSTSYDPCGTGVKPIYPDYNKFNYSVISSVEYMDEDSSRGLIVKASFHCVLYNIDGDSMVIEDGMIRSVYMN